MLITGLKRTVGGTNIYLANPEVVFLVVLLTVCQEVGLLEFSLAL
jgi:hypothetical protein